MYLFGLMQGLIKMETAESSRKGFHNVHRMHEAQISIAIKKTILINTSKQPEARFSTSFRNSIVEFFTDLMDMALLFTGHTIPTQTYCLFGICMPS